MSKEIKTRVIKMNKFLFIKVLVIISFVLTTKKIVNQFYYGDFYSLIGWVSFGIWIIWILLAFKKNLDLPGVGPFKYKEGKNQPARILFMNITTITFLLAAIFS